MFSNYTRKQLLNEDNEIFEDKIEEDIINEYEIECFNELKNIKINKSNKIVCDGCKSEKIIKNEMKGYVICGSCNMIISNIIDTNFSFVENNEENSNLAGTIMVNKELPETSTLTILVGNYSKNIKRLKNWDAIEYNEKKKNEIYSNISKICLNYNFNKCIEETAKIIYNRVYDYKMNGLKNSIFRGINYKSLIANCFFYSCKYNKLVITTKEISKIFNIKKTDMKKGAKIFKNLSKEKNFVIKCIPFTTEDFLIKYYNKLNLNMSFIDNSLTIVKNVLKIKIANSHNPESIAIGVLFLILDLNNINISKKYIAELFNISQVTISKTYNKIKPFNGILLNNNLCDILEKKITKYQENIHNDNIFISNCLKFNKTIPKLEFDNNKEYYIKLRNLIKLQDFEILNKKIFIQNKIMEIKILNYLTKYKSLKNNYD